MELFIFVLWLIDILDSSDNPLFCSLVSFMVPAYFEYEGCFCNELSSCWDSKEESEELPFVVFILLSLEIKILLWTAWSGLLHERSIKMVFLNAVSYSCYLELEFLDIFLIGFLFFRRPEPSPIEDLADETSVVVIDTSLIPGYRKGDTFKLLFHRVMICIIMS